MPVPNWAQSGPLLIGFLFVVVFCRAQGTYWAARAIPAGLIRSQSSNPKRKGLFGRIAAWFEGPTPRKGAALLERWGIIIIPLCFLTVGLQTAVLAGAGLSQMRWSRFTIAMLPGCIAWAFLYGLGMLAVWMAAVTTIARSPWALLAIAGALAIICLVYVIKKASSKRFDAS